MANANGRLNTHEAVCEQRYKALAQGIADGNKQVVSAIRWGGIALVLLALVVTGQATLQQIAQASVMRTTGVQIHAP